MPAKMATLLVTLLLVSVSGCGGSSSSSNTSHNEITPDPKPTVTEPVTDNGVVTAISKNDCPSLLNTSSGSLWCWLDPSPQGNHILNIATGDGRYAFVGYHSTLLMSSDLESWNNINVPLFNQNPFYDAAFSDKSLVLSSVRETFISDDYKDWKRSDEKFSSLAIHYANGLWVSVGIGSHVAVSDDGEHWEVSTIHPSAKQSDFLEDVYYANGHWVIVGNSGSIYYSADAKQWIKPDVDSNVDLKEVSYADDKGIWVTVGYEFSTSHNVLVSTDLSTWRTYSSNNEFGFSSIIYDGNNFIASSLFDSDYISRDGTDWFFRGAKHSSLSRAVLHYDDENQLLIKAGVGGRISTSLDSNTWINKVSPKLGSARSIEFSESEGYAIVGQQHTSKGGLLISSDGKDWSEIQVKDSSLLSDIKYASGVWITVGVRGNVYRSTNKNDWSQVFTGSNWLRNIDHDPITGRWVAVGWAGKVLTSTDSINWTQVDSKITSNLESIYYANNLWVAGGANNTLIHSEDGINWQNASLNNSNSLSGSVSEIIHTDTGWKAFGGTYNYYTSQDGKSWDLSKSKVGNIEAVSFGNGEWRAVTLSGEVYSTVNFLDWKLLNSGSDFDADFDILFDGNKWIVVSEFGAVRFEAVN